jgi:poly(ADP-ribose) glycohydrolase ARH3
VFLGDPTDISAVRCVVTGREGAIVAEGTWLYGGRIRSRIVIVRRMTRYGTGDVEDPAEVADDRDEETFEVLYAFPTEPNQFPAAGGQYPTLSDARAAVEAVCGPSVTWNTGSTREDRVRGAILGSVLGDAFGAPLEGASPTDLRERVAHRAAHRAPWRYTDDGAMVIAVAESLFERSSVDPVHLLQRLSARYEPARGFGRGMKIALAAFGRGVPWHKCAFEAWPEGSRGNGGAVRVVAIAATRWANPAQRDEAVHFATRVTHAHPDAIAMALLQATALATIVDSPTSADDSATFLSFLRAQAGQAGCAAETLDKLAHLLSTNAADADAARALGTTTLATESTPIALWAFLRHRSSFDEAVCAAALLGGDVDSICSMTGALAGAYHGADGLPEPWLENLAGERPSPEELKRLGDRVATMVPGS